MKTIFYMDFFRDLAFLIAGLASVVQYRLNGTEKLTIAIVAYNMIAAIFQMVSHILEKKFLDSERLLSIVTNIIISVVIAFALTWCLVPIPK